MNQGGRSELQEAAGAGSSTAQRIIGELQRMHRDAPDGIHFFAFAAGLLMTVVAIENFWSGLYNRSK